MIKYLIDAKNGVCSVSRIKLRNEFETQVLWECALISFLLYGKGPRYD